MENIIKYEFEDGTVINITVKTLLDFRNTKEQVKHQKKVIDRLSRKIQRLNKKISNFKTGRYLNGKEVILMSDSTWNQIVNDEKIKAIITGGGYYV